MSTFRIQNKNFWNIFYRELQGRNYLIFNIRKKQTWEMLRRRMGGKKYGNEQKPQENKMKRMKRERKQNLREG
jgi:hypothetical protein